LVVRRVTSEIVRDVLAPACAISPDEADAAFKALGQEIWMVIPEDQERTVLRHRPDLRARTLPLMRRRNPDKFREVNHDAIAYFGRHRRRSHDDYAEWIYHRMLADEPIESLEPDLTDDALARLQKAEADFAPGSAAASYLAARTAQAQLSPKRIRELQPMDALRHLSVTSAGTFSLDDNDVDRVALDVAGRLEPAAVAGRDLEGWATALWIKTGAWRKVTRGGPSNRLSPPLLRAQIYWAARTAPRMPDQTRAELLATWVGALGGDRAGVRSTVQALALARLEHAPAFDELDAIVTRLLKTARPNPLVSMQAALRTAIVLGRQCRLPALELWLAARRRGTSDRVRTPSFARRELDGLAALHPTAAEIFGPAMGPSRPLRFVDDRTVATALSVLDNLIGEAKPASIDALSRVFACRHEDWIVPLGHAAARQRSGVPPALREALAQYANGADLPIDMLGAFRFADEAGDLPAFVELVAGQSDDGELHFLVDAFRAWTRALDRELGPRNAGAVAFEAAGKSTATFAGQAVLSSPPPPPPPIFDEDDPQKDRWGGLAERDGRALRATLTSVEKDTFYFSLVVESIDGSPLEAPVIFHLHDSYQQDVRPVTRVVDGKQASLRDLDAYGVFTVGVQVKDGSGRWTSLEFDLATLPRLPKRFLDR
jgi:hypothetical protein